jgi:hypothetical protein
MEVKQKGQGMHVIANDAVHQVTGRNICSVECVSLVSKVVLEMLDLRDACENPTSGP